MSPGSFHNAGIEKKVLGVFIPRVFYPVNLLISAKDNMLVTKRNKNIFLPYPYHKIRF
jgi:hypothetical protein